jgi:succinate dehydrogenase flavin-adding protein (antitoxin of CptAB toxin-antitoxin module)
LDGLYQILEEVWGLRSIRLDLIIIEVEPHRKGKNTDLGKVDFDVREDKGINADPVWSRFSDEANSSMTKLLENEKMDLIEGCLFADKYRGMGEIDDEIIQFVENVIYDIDANRDMYDDVRIMFKNKVDKVAFVEYMDRP